MTREVVDDLAGVLDERDRLRAELRSLRELLAKTDTEELAALRVELDDAREEMREAQRQFLECEDKLVAARAELDAGRGRRPAAIVRCGRGEFHLFDETAAAAVFHFDRDGVDGSTSSLHFVTGWTWHPARPGGGAAGDAR